MTREKNSLFMTKIKKTHCQGHMENIFLYFAAPILSGVKPASLITLQPHCLSAWSEQKGFLGEVTGLKFLEVSKKKGVLLLFIYDEIALQKLLQRNESLSFLRSFGYPLGCDFGEILDFLYLRFLDMDFPHEIGLFLGYPIEDVLGFINNKGKNFLYCRYWKVYHDVKRAKEIFCKIDRAQNHAIYLLYRTTPLNIAANLLKAV